MKYNVLELKTDFSKYIPPDLEEINRAARMWSFIAQTNGQEYQPPDPLSKEYYPIGIYIDGESLIEIIREIEKPFVAAENEARVLEQNETEDEMNPLRAGEYRWLPASMIYPPSRNLLGEPYDSFEMNPTDKHWGKSILLGCTCGVIDCWFLSAKITFAEDSVIWSDFGQFHREWDYPLRPFVFERRQYEAQLNDYL